MGKQVEGLEHDPDATTDSVGVDAFGGDLLAFHGDPPGIDRLEQVDAAEQRGFSRARCADEADDLVLGDGQVDAAQDLERPEGLVQVLDAQRGGRWAGQRATPAR